MGSIILPNQWARQPQYPAPLNLNGFCRDVGFVYLPNIGYVDLANKVTFSVITELTSRAGNNQIGGYPTSGTGYANTGPTNFSLGYTLFAVCSASGTAYEAIMDDDTGGTRGFQFRFTNTGAINFIPFTNADGFASVQSNNYTAAELAAGAAVVARVDASGNIAVFGKGGKFTGSLGAAPRIPGNLGTNLGIRFFRWKGGGNQLTKPLFMAGALNRVASDAEAFAFLENPWKQVFAPQQRRIWVPSAGVGGGVTIDCNLGTATASGFQATVSSNVTIGASLGTATASGFQATVSSAVTVNCALGSASASGFQATVSSGQTINAALGVATASGFSATISANQTINASLGVASAIGYPADISVGGAATINCNLGTATASGFAATVSSPITIAANLGTAAAGGYQAVIAEILQANLGTAVASGYQAIIVGSDVVNCFIGTANAIGYQADIVETTISRTFGIARAYKQEFTKRSNIQTSRR